METTQEKNEKIISTLNNLVEINNDRVQGYTKAIAENQDADLDEIFKNMAAHSSANINELSDIIMKLGGTATDGTKNSGKLFRVWMDLKAALTGKNKQEILSSCEFGEDAALEVYESVLKEENSFLTSEHKGLVEKQKQGIQKDHDKIKSMRDSGARSN